MGHSSKYLAHAFLTYCGLFGMPLVLQVIQVLDAMNINNNTLLKLQTYIVHLEDFTCSCTIIID